ncbi:MAG: cupredoxin family protein [Gammaproteobacteria bacterium]|nr:cupredoxin family protein [Gammaproteobacteria bacterium]
MLIKKIFIAIVLSGAVSGVVLAGGSHGHDDHGMTSGGGHSGHDMGSMGHGDEEGSHGHEISPVGQPAMASQATKTIRVSAMDTMRYHFSSKPDLQAGDIVKFVITNEGKINHEFSIGDEEEQEEHRAMMRKMPGMVHADGNTVTIKPGETKELTWQFKGDDEVIFACNIPGHFEAGMFAKSKIGAPEEAESHHGGESHGHH